MRDRSVHAGGQSITPLRWASPSVTGFTLLESVIVMAIFSLFAFAATALWRSGLETFETTGAQMDSTFEMRRAINRLTAELRQASVNAPITIDNDGHRITFQLPAQVPQDLDGDGEVEVQDLNGDGIPDTGELNNRDPLTGNPLFSAPITYERLEDGQLMRTQNGVTQPIARRVSALSFAQPDAAQPGLVAVNLTFERQTLTGQTFSTPLTMKVFCRNGG